MTPLAAYENLRTFARRWGKKYPSLARLDRERNAAYFTYLRFPENVRRMIYSTNWVERLNRCYKRTLLMRGAMPSPASVVLSLGLCCQGENGRDECKTTAVFSGMENQVKRQIKFNITNSPPAWGTPSRRGRTKENLTHFFGHYRLKSNNGLHPYFMWREKLLPDSNICRTASYQSNIKAVSDTKSDTACIMGEREI